MNRNLVRAGSILASLCLLMTIVQCNNGGGGSGSNPVQVTITSPTTAQTVAVNGTLAITAGVTNGASSGVTWTVNGVTNGNATYGTISVPGSGASSLAVTYTAPAAVPSTATFNITATSAKDTSKSASLSVTISSGVVVSITTPTSPQNISVSSTVAFTASITGTSNTAVTWTVNGATNGNATYGTITGTGLNVSYNAPSAVPTPATFNVTATSTADSTKSASVSVTITPGVGVSISSPVGAQSVAVNAALAFTAAVTGTSNTGVTWTVNGVTNGNSTFGTISGSGLAVTYTAPAAVPTPATFNVTATSTADASKSASVAVTITIPATISITSPSTSTASVAVSGSLPLTASVSGTSNTAVTWTVNGITNGNSTYGTITGSGLSVTYDAPTAVPTPATFKITATSQADSAASASINVTITATSSLPCGSGNEAILDGHYAFQLKGFNNNGFGAAVGSLILDGAGHITGGEVDLNSTLATASTNSTVSASPASTYSVGADNRGCATIVTTSGSTFNTRFDVGVISSGTATQGQMMEFDPAGSGVYIASGQIYQQNTASFTLLEGGGYVHLLTGWDSTTHARIVCGGVHTNGTNEISNAEETCNDAGTVATSGPSVGGAGSYTDMDSNGRFTETVGTSVVAAYMISENGNPGVPTVLSLSTSVNGSNTQVLAGEATFQNQNTFSLSSLLGSYVIYANGMDSASSGKVFLAVASGNGAGTLAFNSYDENDAGTWLSTTTAPSLTYTVDFIGGVTLKTAAGSLNAGHLYLTGNGPAVYIGADSGEFAGYAFAQTGNGSFGNSSLDGTFFGGTTEILSQAAQSENDMDTVTRTGSVSIVADDSSTSGLLSDQTSTETLTIALTGAFTTSASPSQVIGIVINSSTFLIANDASTSYPTVQLLTLNAPPI